MHIIGRKKKGYIIGRKVALTEDNPNYDEWEAEDTLVKPWLINYMTDRLMSQLVQCGTAKEVWDAIKRSYLYVFDSSQVYELMKKSFQSHQGAIDHMTSHSSPFDSLMPSLVKSVQVANGTPMSNLEAKNVSLPPHSPYNLTKMRIDIGKKRGGLYYLERGKISSKEEERLWLEEKRLWILGQEEDSIDLGKGESVDTLNPMTAKFASKERRDRRPAKLFQQGYTKKNKDATVIPSSRLPYS
ncbi:hypothetical protein AAG906_017498 [Vitis piasezkii]